LLSASRIRRFSDHATAAYAIAVAILLRHRKAGLLAPILATLVAARRNCPSSDCRRAGDGLKVVGLPKASMPTCWAPSGRSTRCR